MKRFENTNTVLDSIDGDEPISLHEANKWAYVTGGDQELVMDELITAAREYCEANTWQQVIEATLIHYRDSFPIDEFELPVGPVISVDKIEYIDGDETKQTLASSEYDVDLYSHFARIQPIDGWPDTTNDLYNTVIVTFRAGYDGSNARLEVPKKIVQAMKLMIKHWYDNRGSVIISEGQSIDVKEVPMTARALLDLESKKHPV